MSQLINPFNKKNKREIITSIPKFYLFDVSVASSLMKRSLKTNRGSEFGKAFEHFILMKIIAYRSYSELDFPIHYWRTKTGHEVDFILDHGKVAIKIKESQQIKSSSLKALKAFIQEHQPKKSIIVCQEPVPRKLESGIEIYPWKLFLELLWKKKNL